MCHSFASGKPKKLEMRENVGSEMFKEFFFLKKYSFSFIIFGLLLFVEKL